MDSNCVNIKKKRKRTANTSVEQLEEYLRLMESDDIFRTNTLNPSVSPDYIEKTWDNLAKKLNSCDSGPTLSTKEWIKRFNDWKNNTRAKYRKLAESRLKTGGGEGETIILTAIEDRALAVWGKVAVTGSNKVRVVAGLQTYSQEIPQVDTSASLTAEEALLETEVNETMKLLSNEEIEAKEGEQSTQEMTNEEHVKKTRVSKKSIKTPKIPKIPWKENRSVKLIGEELLSEYKKDTSNKDKLRLEERQIELEIAKFKFEVAKYKFENPAFSFDIDL